MGFIFFKFSKLGSGAKPPPQTPPLQWLRQTNFSNPPTPCGLATPLGNLEWFDRWFGSAFQIFEATDENDLEVAMVVLRGRRGGGTYYWQSLARFKHKFNNTNFFNISTIFQFVSYACDSCELCLHGDKSRNSGFRVSVFAAQYFFVSLWTPVSIKSFKQSLLIQVHCSAGWITYLTSVIWAGRHSLGSTRLKVRWRWSPEVS